MSERFALLVVIACSTSGCLTRDVDLEIHTPAQCCAGPDCAEPACPLSAVHSIRTTLEAVDGTALVVECMPAPEGLCSADELTGYVFIERVAQPSDAVEVRVEGWTGEDCTGELALGCDSFGAYVVDLVRDTEIAIFCECPLVTSP